MILNCLVSRYMHEQDVAHRNSGRPTRSGQRRHRLMDWSRHFHPSYAGGPGEEGEQRVTPPVKGLTPYCHNEIVKLDIWDENLW